MHMCIYKESVELIFVYPIEGCGKTLTKKKRHNTPHRSRYGVSRHKCTYPMNLHEVSVVPFVHWSRKLPHFQSRTCEKHFHKYVIPNGSTDWLYKSKKKFLQTNNTHGVLFSNKKNNNPLFLLNNGQRFALHFDCKSCEMTVKEA